MFGQALGQSAGRSAGRGRSQSVNVETVNYFFDDPIELHLIAVLWLMREGRHLDAKFLPECCGSRLSPKLHEENDDSLQLFTKYHEQYSRWRDTGISEAKHLLVEERRSVAKRTSTSSRSSQLQKLIRQSQKHHVDDAFF
jgi:hypothetical protein